MKSSCRREVLVTGAVVLSTSPCNVGGISANISIFQPNKGFVFLFMIQFQFF